MVLFQNDDQTQSRYVKLVLKAIGTKIKLNIVNLMKPFSLYSKGMKPCVKSENHENQNGVSWHRDCYDISYTMNTYTRSKPKIVSKLSSSDLK